MCVCSVVEQAQVGVHQSDALLVAGVDHDLVGRGAGRSSDVLHPTLQGGRSDRLEGRK